MYVHLPHQEPPEAKVKVGYSTAGPANMTPTTFIERSTRLCEEECHSQEDEGPIAQGVAQWAVVAVENHLDQAVVGAKVASAKS